MNVKKLAYCGILWYCWYISLVSYACYRDRPIKQAPISRIQQYVKDTYIASVIEQSKYPYLLAVMAKVESDFRPRIKGDGGDSFGLWQIQEKHWGRVGETIEEQCRMAETILESLIKVYGYPKAIERWNGQGKQARDYRRKVLKEMERI